jgi:hypothetical protein
MRLASLLIAFTLLGAPDAFAQTPTPKTKKPVTVKKATPESESAKKEDKTGEEASTAKPPVEKDEPVAKEPTVLENVKAGAEDIAKDASKGVEQVKQALNTTRENRAAREWTITGNYNFFEMWVMTKYGFTLGWNRSPSSTYEFEYMKGSIGLGKYGIDLADISETRMSLLWRSYGKRQSFNFITGLYYNELEAGFGSDFLSSVPGGYVEVLGIKTLGVTWGLGNRWITKGGFVWGFDWFAVHIPVLILEKNDDYLQVSSSQDDRDEVSDAIDIFTHLPALGALKLQLGFSW